MQKKLRSLIVAAVIAGCLSVLATVSGETINYPTNGTLRVPQTYFNDANLPATTNSLFPTSTPSGNSVTVNGNIAGHVYGGIAMGTKPAGQYQPENSIDNTVIINSGNIGSSAAGGNVTGGWSLIGNVTNNEVRVNGGAIYNIIFGGWIRGDGDARTNGSIAKDNRVIISAGTIRDNVYGAYTQESLGKLENNTVTINGGTFTKNGSSIVGGYSALGVNEVSDNKVTISGGTFTNSSIYGGRGQTTSAITGNSVIISGGTINAGEIYGGELIRGSGTGSVTGNSVSITNGTVNSTIYGGYAGAAGANNTNAATGNSVSISGGSVTGAIYAGYSTANGDVTNNTVTISGNSTVRGDLYGGYGKGNVFDGNTLNLTGFNSNSYFGTVQNFQTINFGFSGNAKIETLYTTATGSALDGITVNTDTHNVQMDGLITGSGDLAKTGTGTFILTADSTIGGDVTVAAGGTLQFGNGGTTGSISTTKVGGFFGLVSGSILAYNRSNSYVELHRIVGAGKVVQRGTGTLTLTGNNTFTGGTVIESGTLNIVNSDSYGRATSTTTERGFITFAPMQNGSVAKGKVVVYQTDDFESQTYNIPDYGSVTVSLLENSFRTQTGAGNGADDNVVDLTAFTDDAVLAIGGVNINRQGGAFYVDTNTTMTVNAGNLMLLSNHASQGNDLYVASNGTFNLNATSEVLFRSGIAGNGQLNISTTGVPGSAALVRFDPRSGATFSMGETHVAAKAGTTLLLDLMGGAFENTRSFTLSGSGGNTALISGGTTPSGGTVWVGNLGSSITGNIHITDGAMLALVDGVVNLAPAHLMLVASTIELNDILILYGAGAGTTQNNNSLLLAYSPGERIAIKQNSGVVGILSPFAHGDYLVIQTLAGFKDVSGTALATNDRNMDDYFIAESDGFIIESDVDKPRGTYGFKLGGTSNDVYTTGTNNLWLTNSLNSLTMDWTAGTGDWNWRDDNDLFESRQTGISGPTTTFMPGDKVVINNTSGGLINIEVSAGALGNNIVVSGLVVDGTANTTFRGDGGIIADKDSAFGDYTNAGNPDYINPTGKLEKSGGGILAFENTGGNLFMEGIDIYDGTVAFTQADQLSTGDMVNGVPDNDKPITFKANDTTLHALKNVTLQNIISVDDNVTGNIGVEDGATWRHEGTIIGTLGATSFALKKTGGGTLWLADNVDFAGNVTVTAGTLSGTGVIGSTIVEPGGTLKPGGLSSDVSTAPVPAPLTVNGNLTFAADSIFDVRIVPSGTGRKLANDSVIVNGTVDIAPAAKLNVEVDYWSGPRTVDLSDRFTIINGNRGVLPAEFGSATLAGNSRLPRGITLEHGWSSTNEYQLWFGFDPSNGFGSICIRHNRSEIGKTLDWFIVNQDPGLQDLIDRLSDPNFTDPQVCEMLDQLHGDLSANAMFMALKEPWRHPFNRLKYDCPIHATRKFGRELWGEFTARYENVDFDNNAHSFTINRYGLAVGVDQRLSRNSIVGVNFQYAEPCLRQATGKVETDDCEFGLYGMTRMADNLNVRTYLGYSHQRYEFDRSVSLPASGSFADLYARLHGNTSGDALSASIELIQSFALQNGVRLSPVVALDYEKVWMSGYRESGGDTALVYDNAILDKLMFRIGFGGELDLSRRLALNTRLQCATQLNNQEYPAVGVRFANGSATQRTAEIWGSRIGRDYLNLGLGANWKLDNRGTALLHVNYDARWYNRATFHIGEAGLVKKW